VSTYATEKGFCHSDKVVVILDEWSASASEIFAGAIQDNDRGMIVGRRSFGKALVQEPTMFSDGSSMRLTIARYYTPTGRCNQKSYSNGLEDYFMELGERYDNGEFEVKDSIHFSDSLKYQTAGGRTVYGGGGIMPDVFVPVDTTGVSDFYTNASNKGLIYQFAFDYTDNHRAELSAYKSVADLEKILNTRNLMKLFIAYAEKNGLPADQDGLEISGEVIFVQIKAYIARNLLDNKGFYPIIKQLDTTLLKAVDVISAM
ncbi:MAG: S41 family peptidase, partial [Bacteroidota bacterium]